MEWREIAVTVSSQGEEMVADLFYQLGCPGVSIESPELLQSYIESGVWDDHAFGEIEGLGTAIVKGYFPVDDELGAKIARLENGLKQLLAQFPDWVVKVTGTSLNEEDWATAWKAYYKPLRVGRNFLVKPTWEEAGADPGVIVIELDPGMAFGTGTHPTTVLCLCALEDVVRTGQKVYDVGTGSGILAIAAAKLGATVDAVDCDPVAVQAAKDNVALNQVSDRVRVHRGDLATALNGEADIVVANITADAIITLLPDLRRILKRDGEFLASGIIVQRAEEVRQKMDEAGLAVVEQREDAGWVLLRARWTSNASL